MTRSTSTATTTAEDSLWGRLYNGRPPRTEAVARPGQDIAVSVWEADGVGAHTSSRPDVILVHGGAAHRGWWDHIAPQIRGAGRIFALDLTGHGDSSRRPAYTFELWAEDVSAVADALCRTRPVLVGHSMGGLVSVQAAQQSEDRYAAVLALDSPLQRIANGNIERRDKIANRPVRVHRTRTEALSSFKTYPQANGAPPEVMAHVASASFHEIPDGWVLKFDPLVYRRPQAPEDFVHRAAIPTSWVRAEDGFIDDRMAAIISDALGPKGRLVDMPSVGHHLTLEQPIATAWLISAFVQNLVR